MYSFFRFKQIEILSDEKDKNSIIVPIESLNDDTLEKLILDENRIANYLEYMSKELK